jgi:LPS export ABC transporter protein LptC
VNADKILSIKLKNLIYILAIITLASCEVDLGGGQEAQIYEGPMVELEDVIFYYSDSAQVKVKGTTPHRMEYADGNQEFPKGLYLEFYDELGKIESTIKADIAYYNKEKNEWLGQQNVVVENSETGQQLNTEELFWLPTDERIYTDKFVTIKREGEILHGRGLEASQDLSTYSITNPEGEFLLKENEEL